MSTWTHINGSIRFDGLRHLNWPTPESFLGNTTSFESPWEALDECTVPRGSEGSLQYFVWNNPFENALSAWTVAIFGDLRDYDNEQEIIDYFQGLTVGEMRLIRQGVFSVQVEGKDERVFLYSQQSKTFEEMKKCSA